MTATRFAIWIWKRGVDDFIRFALPSIMQPNNLPWLMRNGYPVALDFYTIDGDAAAVEALALDLRRRLRELAPAADVETTLFVTAGAGANGFDLKRAFFQALVRRGVETGSHGLFVFADMVFGDGSIRNIVRYGQKPGVTVGGLYLRVKERPFVAALARHHAVTGGSTISNARLVDIALDTLIDGMNASIVDADRNASAFTSGSLRRIADDLYTYTFHAPTPLLYAFTAGDARFFETFDWNFYLLDHLWPSLLIAQNRWRLLTSSDLFFFAELNPEATETEIHTHPLREGMRYNDEYAQEHLNGRLHQTLLLTLRRERLPGGAA